MKKKESLSKNDALRIIYFMLNMLNKLSLEDTHLIWQHAPNKGDRDLQTYELTAYSKQQLTEMLKPHSDFISLEDFDIQYRIITAFKYLIPKNKLDLFLFLQTKNTPDYENPECIFHSMPGSSFWQEIIANQFIITGGAVSNEEALFNSGGKAKMIAIHFKKEFEYKDGDSKELYSHHELKDK